jgi:predicted Ser/Thr protein kinase
MPLSKSALAYRNNPASAKKHAEYNTKRNKSKERTAYRVELNRERRKRGIYGKGGPDMSHTESGKLVEEEPSKNRGRNGARGESTKRKDFVEGKGKKCGRGYIHATDKCTKGSGVRTAAKIALGAGLVAGTIALSRGSVHKTTPYVRGTPVLTWSSPKALLSPATKPKIHKVKAAPNLKLHRELESKLKARFFRTMDNYNDLVTRRTYNVKHKYVLVEFLDNNYGVATTPKGQIEFMAFARRDKSGKVYTKEIVFTTEGSYSPIKDKVTAKDSMEVFSKVERMLQKAIESDPSDLVLTTSPISPGLNKIYTRYGFKEHESGDYLITTVGELKKRSRRNDALRARKGKKCGESFIPRNHKCGADAPSSGITPKKAVILGAGAALGVVAALRARSLWTPALSRLYAEARKANRPWDTYAKKLKEDLRDLDVRRFAKARNDLKKRICSRGDARLDAWSKCKFAIGEASSFGRVLKHPNQPIVFKVPKENYYVPVSNGKQMTGTKQLHRRVAKMFDQEAENLQLANRLKVDSPRLEGYNPNTRTIAMEFLQGFDTYRSIRRKFPNLDRAVEFQLFANLRKMHTNGLVHMDLHPGNVLVNPATKRISIIDFGTSERSSNLAPFDFLDLVHTEVTTVTKLTLPLSVKQKGLILDSRDKYLPVIKGAKAYYTTVPDAQIPNNIEQFYQDVGTILLSS